MELRFYFYYIVQLKHLFIIYTTKIEKLKIEVFLEAEP